MIVRPAAALLVGLLLAPAAGAAPTAQQVTAGNAADLLFGGSDAVGGVGDWYLSNGVVEAIVDDVGPQVDLVPLLGPAAPVKQSSGARSGGTLVDLGLVGADNDQLGQMFTTAALSSANLVIYRHLTAATVGDAASVTATGVVPGFDRGGAPVPPENLEIVTTYTAAGDDPFITITSTVTNTHPTNPAPLLTAMIDPIVWTTHAILPFSPLAERGFRHGILNLSNPLVALEQPAFIAGPGILGPADGPGDAATGTPIGEVAYGLLGIEVSLDQDGAGGAPPVVTPVARLFGVSNNTTTALGNAPAGGALQPGGVFRYVRRVYVGGHNDVASVANLILPEIARREAFDTGTISGDVDGAESTTLAANLIATRTGGPATPFPAGTPVTQIRTDADGRFGGVVLPVGTYDLTVRSPERTAVSVTGVTVTAGTDTAVTVPPLEAVGTVVIRALEVRPGRGRPLPARVVFTGVDGTPDPSFRRDFDASLIDPSGGPDVDLHPETFGGGPAQGNIVVLGTEPVSVQVRPGTYELVATRGFEYGVQRQRVKVKARGRQRLTFRLRRLVDVSDALSADFHVHSARSFDASAPLYDRVRSFAAEGVEVMVATDHDMLTDYAPVIGALGLQDRIASIVGDEVTTAVSNPPAFEASIGHLNGWPMVLDPTGRKRGAIEDEFVAPNMIFSRFRAAGARVVQYNHPRATLTGLTSLGIFTNIGYDPDLAITSEPNAILLDRDILGPGRSGVNNPDGFRNLDFDTVEVANGLSVDSYLAVRRDWLSLLNQTDFATVPFIAATGVSDSHRLTVETPGYFRTYVTGVGDQPARLDRARFDARVTAGAMMVSNGPLISAHVEASDGTVAGPGETVGTGEAAVTLAITVEAVPWIPVEEVRVIANGFVVATFDRTSSPAVRPAPRNAYSRARRGVRRFQARVPVTVLQDTYIVVEAGARLDPATPAAGPAERLVPGLVPIAFTNPLFVDRGSDGFTPPGLPVMATASGAGEPLPAFAQVRVGDTISRLSGRPRAQAARIPSGAEQRARLARDRTRHTADYFPLFTVDIPTVGSTTR
jgi:hypothetical protein